MAITHLLNAESGRIWPGDAVFCYTPGTRMELHVGVYVGVEQEVSPKDPTLAVRSVPGEPGTCPLGVAIWGTPGSYVPHLLGRRRDFRRGTGRAVVHQVADLSQSVATEHSQLPPRECGWAWPHEVFIDQTRRVRGGVPLFVRGTCAQFTEYLYEYSDLDLIVQAVTFNPREKQRIYPATQIHVFWTGRYGLRDRWDARYESYPACVFGSRSET